MINLRKALTLTKRNTDQGAAPVVHSPYMADAAARYGARR